MKVTRKFADFVKLEDAQGHLPKLAGMGAAVASSFAVGLLVPTVAFACNHADVHDNAGYDQMYGFWGWLDHCDYHDNNHDNGCA